MEAPDAQSITVKIQLLNTSEPMAFSPGGGFILVSRGFVRLMENEAELAFVLGHEMAHYILHHAPEVDRAHLNIDRQRELELEADSLAVRLVSEAGYDPRAGALALLRAHDAAKRYGMDGAHPAVELRIRVLQDTLTEESLYALGVLDRRDFQSFKAALLSKP